MAATPFFCYNSSYQRIPRRNNIHSAVVMAETSADALAMLAAQYNDTILWGATATATTMAAAADLTGWTLRIDILSAALTLTGTVSVVGASGATLDTIAALFVTAVNAAGLGITNASYNAGTNVLTVAGAADNKGASRIVVTFSPPNSEVVSIPGFVGAITHQGSAGAPLTVALAADSYTVPAFIGKMRDQGPEF